MAENAAPDDKIIGRMQLEKEQFTHGNCTEVSIAARLPEVDLVRSLLAEQFEPTAIGDGDK